MSLPHPTNSLITQRLTTSTPHLDSVLAAAYTIIRLAFANTLITRTRYPHRNPRPDAGSDKPPSDVARYVTERLGSDPTFRMVVARDSARKVSNDGEVDNAGEGEGNGEIISVATYNIFSTQEELVGWLDERSRKDGLEGEGANLEACREFRDMIIKSKREHLVGEGKGGAIVLDTLSTHPKHQRRGAGKLLVDWGTDIADDKHLPIYLEASLQGEPLYRKCGFDRAGIWRWDVSRFEKAEKMPDDEKEGGQVNVEEGDDLVELSLMMRKSR